MQIHIKRLDENFLMEAKNEHQNTILIDSSAGETPKGMSPMQLLLAGIGACSTIDIISILKKQRQNANSIEIIVNGDRVETIPKVFDKIHIHYILEGDLEEEKVKKAIDLSLEKYCSVSKMLEKTAQIDYTFEVKK